MLSFTIRCHVRSGVKLLNDSQDETEEIHEIEKACANGDLQYLHSLYSAWLARQQPDPSTGEIRKGQLYLAAYGATNDTLWENRSELREWAKVGALTPPHHAARVGMQRLWCFSWSTVLIE